VMVISRIERCEGIFYEYTSITGEKWCEDNRLPNGDTQCADCSDSLKRELERFASLIDAVRDLLRWIDVANRLELASVVLRSNMGNVIAEYGCDVDCRWDHDTRILPGEGCDGGSALCESHAMQRVLDMHYEDEGKLQREGELILAKGFATQ